ncbi:hypothetical protein DFH08DRAFT_1085951 [Mycena albidolilacea]|uniref:Uncharacterized protein n=1 Tax=Mycena albidolilacea TaxID=1033008 RepID=A0AAD7EGF7_9AGAR|nr:hypothetical protein DFH08DRAFT_1085951 [Mycena albidolilacea]
MNIDEEALVEHQKSSTELVVYSRLAEKAVTVSCVTEDILGFCHHDSPRCAFKINLTSVYKTCLLKSSYPHLPTLQSGGAPDMETLLVAFNLRRFPLEWDFPIAWFIKSQAESDL